MYLLVRVEALRRRFLASLPVLFVGFQQTLGDRAYVRWVRPCGRHVPSYLTQPTAPSLSRAPSRLPRYFAVDFELWILGDMLPNVGTRLVTTAALSADVDILTAAQASLEVVPVKVSFETAIDILVLARVYHVFLLLPFLYSP